MVSLDEKILLNHILLPRLLYYPSPFALSSQVSTAKLGLSFSKGKDILSPHLRIFLCLLLILAVKEIYLLPLYSCRTNLPTLSCYLGTPSLPLIPFYSVLLVGLWLLFMLSVQISLHTFALINPSHPSNFNPYIPPQSKFPWLLLYF
jgi:hypothetical protein